MEESARWKSSGRGESIPGSEGSVSKNMEMKHNMMNVEKSAVGISIYTNPIIDVLCQSRCPNVCLVYNLACVHASQWLNIATQSSWCPSSSLASSASVPKGPMEIWRHHEWQGLQLFNWSTNIYWAQLWTRLSGGCKTSLRLDSRYQDHNEYKGVV